MEKKLGSLNPGGDYAKTLAIFAELIEIIKDQAQYVEVSGVYKDINFYKEDGIGYSSTSYSKPNGDVGYTVFITTPDGTIYLNFGPDADQSQVPY